MKVLLGFPVFALVQFTLSHAIVTAGTLCGAFPLSVVWWLKAAGIHYLSTPLRMIGDNRVAKGVRGGRLHTQRL